MCHVIFIFIMPTSYRYRYRAYSSAHRAQIDFKWHLSVTELIITLTNLTKTNKLYLLNASKSITNLAGERLNAARPRHCTAQHK